MNLLYPRFRTSVLVPPSVITTTPLLSTTIAYNVVSGTTVFTCSVDGAGEAVGTWAIGSLAGNASTKFVLSGSGASVTVVTTGTMTTSNKGDTTMRVTWTGQGGVPTLGADLTVTVGDPVVLSYNPSKLGWWNLLYAGSGNPARLRTNSHGQMRPYDGVSHYYAPDWPNNLSGDYLWNTRWLGTINRVLDSNNNAGLVLNVAVRPWEGLAPTGGRPVHPGFPALKADFNKTSIAQNYTISSTWPVGYKASNTRAQNYILVQDMWDRYGDGWFDNIFLAPWQYIVNKINALNLPFWRIVLRPCWEMNDIWSPGVGEGSINNQGIGWISSSTDVDIVKKAFKRMIDLCNGLSNIGSNGRFMMSFTPLRNSGHMTLAGDSANCTPGHAQALVNDIPKFAGTAADPKIFDFIGCDSYDRGMKVGPGFDNHTPQQRFAVLAGDTTSYTACTQLLKGTQYVNAGCKLILGEWGASVGGGVHQQNQQVSAPGPTPDKGNGCDDPTYITNIFSIMAANPGCIDMYFQYEQDEYCLNVTNPSAVNPTYVGVSNKPDASKEFHRLMGLSYVP